MNFDQIYSDFSTKVLPLIWQWVGITKEYAYDLFSRYVSYLIVSDSVYLFIGILLLIASYVSFKKIKKMIAWIALKRYDSKDEYYGLYFIPWMLCLFGLIMTFWHIENLITDILVPEVRIIEIIKHKDR